MTVSLPSVKRSLFFFFCLKDAKILFTCKPSEVPWRWCSRQKGSPHYSTTHYPANLSINPRGREYHHPKDKKSNQGGVQINIQSALSTFFFFVPTFLPFRPGGGSLLAYVYEKHEIQNQIRCATTTSKFNVWTQAKSLPESLVSPCQHRYLCFIRLPLVGLQSFFYFGCGFVATVENGGILWSVMELKVAVEIVEGEERSKGNEAILKFKGTIYQITFRRAIPTMHSSSS